MTTMGGEGAGWCRGRVVALVETNLETILKVAGWFWGWG